MDHMGAIEPHASLASRLPAQFGKYALLSHLATGGMAEVWLARQHGIAGFEKIVVIKRARFLDDEDTTRRFLGEARLVATLEHPNIAQVYEIGLVNGFHFFVMEYVQGVDLSQLLRAALAKEHGIPLASALYIVAHVCTGLHYAHEKRHVDGLPLQIVHRDVSPANVLISHDGAVKICDFGIAKVHSRTAENTQGGMLLGKFSYMSPEQCQCKPLDRRSDVFSIGILLYELTTHSKLFRSANDFAVLQQIVEGEIPPPSSRVAGYPRELEHIVMKALAKSPDDRYPTAQALQLDLEAFAREHKLAMSSIGIASLMSALFGTPDDGFAQVRRAPDDELEEPSMALAMGSNPEGEPLVAADDLLEATRAAQTLGIRSAGGSREARSTPVPRPAPRRMAGWLIGAALAAAIAIAVTIADRTLVEAGDRATAALLAADAERLSSALDTAARTAHVRADVIAAIPMLRAAIETDAATLRDIAAHEILFPTDPGEAMEVFQRHDKRVISLLRVPEAAPALPPLTERGTQVHHDGRSVTVLASAPLTGYVTGISGGLVISRPVDLTELRRALAEHAVRASLTGIGPELVLVGSAAGAGDTSITLTVRATADQGTAPAALIATPKPSAGLAWAAPTRTAASGLALLLLAGFGAGLVRRRRTGGLTR
jgi:serine/threonine protein kinase